VGDDCNRGDAIRSFKERGDETCHVENFESPRKDGKRFRVFRLRRTLFDEAVTQPSARALVGKEEAYRACAHDEDVDLQLRTSLSVSN
jgi:hypothetical protein